MQATVASRGGVRNASGTEGRHAAWLFVRLLALIYFSAFASLAPQILGLIGSQGILPAGDYLAAREAAAGTAAWLEVPTLFWLDVSDSALTGACYAGMIAAVGALAGVMESTALLACYVLYLSLVSVGQDFTSFQWDMLLLESGFLALFLRTGASLIPWLYRWLLFRFMFMGGVVKLASGDPHWRDLSALNFHFETQPLPSPLAWYAHHAPDLVLQGLTLLTFVIELGVPFLVFGGRRARLLAALSFLALQGSIILTGNYTFFNLLTLALCVFLLDEDDLCRLSGRGVATRAERRPSAPGRVARAAAGALTALILFVCAGRAWISIPLFQPPAALYSLVRFASDWGIVNGYGPFAVMTTERRELIVEGSEDGRVWQAYEFPFKPGDIERGLSWNIPHQPRLDWQMWFAALGDPRRNTWLPLLLDRLGESSASVCALFARVPFPGRPPANLRLSIYRYSFTTPEERRSSGHVWRRELLGRIAADS